MPPAPGTLLRSFRCPPGRVRGAPTLESRLTSDVVGTPTVTATTYCKNAEWYVSESFGRFLTTPFLVPDDPPIPPRVTVSKFVPLGGRYVPAALVDRETFAGGALYELLTVAEDATQPLVIVPGGSPVLLLQDSQPLQGAGFTCRVTGAGAQVRQYEWYAVDPLKVQTTASGSVVGDPAVFLETTVYTVVSGDAVSSNTLAIAQTGYRQVLGYDADSC